MTRPLWTGTARSRWATPVAAAMVTGAVVLFLTPGWYAGFILMFAAALVLIFRRVTVTVDRRELTVRYGAPWTWPQRIRRHDIRGASVIDLRPMRWGGWGYRGSLRFFRRAAIVLRAGEALQLDLRGGRQLAITVDDPAGAIAALEQ